MKNLFTLLLLSLVSFSLSAQESRSNCPVSPEVVTRTQPDGSKITIRAIGSEMVHYLESTEGYTLLENKDGYLVYATTDAQQNLIAGPVIARDGYLMKANTIQPHLRYSSQQLSILESAFAKYSPSTKKAAGNPFPAKGKQKLAVLLVQYPDLPATIAKNNFDSLMMKKNYNGTGSFRDYYLKTSFGQLELEVDVYGWYTSAMGYINYGKSNTNYMKNVGQLVRGAVLSADSAGVDFAKYDNDSDSYVDGIIIMHSGIGAEEQSAPSANNYIWSHRYSLAYSTGAVLVDGVYVNAYGCFPEKRYSGGSYPMVGIGVISHEFGHLLDLPDLYATNSVGEGAGNYANMAGGPWLNNEKTPCMHDAWSRIQMGWMQATVISASGTYTIPKCVADSNFAFRINTGVANEYWLLENRQKKGFDAYLPSKGLAIWHINTNKAKLLSQSSSNTVNTDTSIYGTQLIQADGKYHLEKGTNRGDAADLFPGTTNNRSLSDYTTPNANLHYKIGGVKQPSTLLLTNITQNADSSITFTIGNKASAGFDASAATGCAPLTVNYKNTSAFAQKYKWITEKGDTSTEKDYTRLYSDSGSYSVKLYVYDSTWKLLDSTTQSIKILASPKASIQITRLDSNRFYLENKSSNYLYSVWRFGSNQSSTLNDLIYTLTGNTAVPFTFIAYSQNQCTDTISGILDFWPLGIQNESILTEIKMYPNPATDQVTLSYLLKQKTDVKVSVLDAQGKTIAENLYKTENSGKQEITLNTSELASGVYFIKIQTDTFNKILRLICR